jgi:hypothetical protein
LPQLGRGVQARQAINRLSRRLNFEAVNSGLLDRY